MKKLQILIILISLLTITPQAQAKEVQNPNANLQYMNLQWWNKFNDENLNNYLGEVYKNNPDLKIATIKAKHLFAVVHHRTQEGELLVRYIV